MNFSDKFNRAIDQNNSFVCVGLDPDPARIPQHLQTEANPVLTFVREIVQATQDLVCAYKPNFAFYGALGRSGWEALEAILDAIPESIPVILDFKAGDIGNTAERYAAMAYDCLGVDATTVNPLMGTDAVEPFLAYSDKCAFLLCLTSNPGSADFQRLQVGDQFFYEALIQKATTWSQTGPCGLVVGATHPEELASIRALAPHLPILLPGIGSQGGNAEAMVQNGLDDQDRGILVNSSRSILYASNGLDFADAARQATEDLRQTLNRARPKAVNA
ncbi:MAG: orotidine-5'-phosphate decarboxylase [bacterium]|nr:orotidine-5'-phosphate decarboxylase [bacterium]